MAAVTLDFSKAQPLPGNYVTPSMSGGPAKGMISPGNVDLSKRPNIDNGDGTHSSVFSMGVNVDGKEMLIPGVGDGKTYPLRKLSVPEAVAQYKKTGQHLGIFSSPDASDAYAQTLHEDQARGNQSAPVQLDFSKAQPLPQAEDARSLLQKAKDKFDALTTVTPEQTAGHGAIVNAMQKFGAGAIQGVGAPIVHPLDTLDAIGHTIAHPWDSAHEEVNALYRDPAKFAGNVAGGAILGEAAAPLVKPIASAVKSGAEKAVLLGKTPEAAYESALKPSTTLSEAERSAAVQTGLKNEIPVSKGGLQSLGDLIDDYNQKIKAVIDSDPTRQIDANKVATRADAAKAKFANQVNAQGDLNAIEASKQQFLKEQSAKMPAPPVHPNPDLLYHGTNQELTELHPKSFVTDDPGEAAAYALRRTTKPLEGDGTERIYAVPKSAVQATGKDVLEGKHYLTETPHPVQDVTREIFTDGTDKPDAITMNAADAQAMKQGTYAVLKGKFGEQGSAAVEAQKALARGLKEEIANQFPEISNLNATESRLLNLEPILERAVNRISNHQAIGIGTPIAGAAAKAVTGSAGIGVIATTLKGVLDNPFVKSKLAIAVSKGAKIPISQAVARVQAYSAALGSSVAGSVAAASP